MTNLNMENIGKNRFVVSVLQANTLNKNGRIYSPEVLKDIEKQFGELDHPMYGELGYPDILNTTLNRASHEVKKVFMAVDKLPRKKKKELKKLGIYKRVKNADKPTLYAEIELTSTTKEGRLAIEFIEGLIVRPRGVGTVSSKGEIQSDYKIVSFDLINKNDDSFENLI